MRATGDFSRASTRQYERAWMRAYGHDFGYVRARSLPCWLLWRHFGAPRAPALCRPASRLAAACGLLGL